MEQTTAEKPKKTAAEQIGESFDEALRRKEIKVIVTDVHMPFWSMVTFLVKLAIAAIPAMLIIMMILLVLAALVPGFGSLFR